MTKRDDFSIKTKTAVALRAAYRCSFSGCDQVTIGLTDEALDSHANVGEAAHICAAAPGGRRYDATMTSQERRHISNAIWLCALHSRLIDRDEAKYTAEILRCMKKDHESECARALRGGAEQSAEELDLIALGSEIVFVGSFLGVEGSEWLIHLSHFVRGDINDLIKFVEDPLHLPRFYKYVLLTAQGDGRVLSSAPSFRKSASTGYDIRCPVEPRFPRSDARTLGTIWAINQETNDIYIEQGKIAQVSGLDSLPHFFRQVLSLQTDESPFHGMFGARFVEYFDNYSDSPWLSRLLKMELTRQAAIPYFDQVLRREYTPLQCVDRVFSMEVAGPKSAKNWLPMHVHLDIHGVGRWDAQISILIPSNTAED